MPSNKQLRARGRRDKPGSGPNYDKAHGLIPSQPDPPKGGKYPNSPAPLIELVVKWCKQHGYHRAVHAIRTQTEKWESTGGYTKPCSWDKASNRYPTLVEIFEEWKKMHPEIPEWMPASEYHAKFILPDALKKEEARKKKEERKKRDEKGEFSDTSISEDDEDDDKEDQEDQEDQEEQEDEDSESESEAGGSVANEVVQPENIPLPESASGSSEEESESDSDESEESDSDSDSDSEASGNEEKLPQTAEVNSAANPLKRKAPASSSSSDPESDAESDSESSEDEEPQLSTELKSSGGGLKRKASPSSTSEDDSSDEETSDEEPVAKKAKLEGPNDSAGSSSSSGEESDEEMEDAASTSSGGSSTSDEESGDDGSESEGETSSDEEEDGEDDEDDEEEEEEESAEEEKSSLKYKLKPSTKPNSGRDIVFANGNASDSSQTLHATSPQFTATELSNHKIGMVNINKDKPNAPFSRISVDQQVDPKFSSNKYVSYDYADKAHRDLIVTKGKNFTKEKNKKKRGAYRGGMIDTASRAIKFDD